MTKNETRHVDHCKHAFEMKSDMVIVCQENEMNKVSLGMC